MNLGIFFPKIRALFFKFRKRARETPPPLPPLVTRLISDVCSPTRVLYLIVRERNPILNICTC